ncbi:hypothetical protein BJV78DRAFT_1277838 [Lactifluus subvellereus]|nr:hypothetical protein BJV78DRAFT_1277838 [Lactifluus subvellereus]
MAANLIRSAKSGSGWTLNDVEAYHISLNQVDPLLFFGLQELPQPSVDQELLSNADADAMQQDCNAELITYLDLAMIPEKGEIAVDDFAVELFRVLGYVMPGIVMVGTSPVFFKIPVTRTLSAHIRRGTYPPEETHVTYCYPPVPRPARRHSEGMKPLEA